MSLERAETIAAAFANYWNFLLREYPRYQLDYCWPSVGVVDLILHRYRGQAKLELLDEQAIYSASCYLSVICARCWEQFPGSPKIVVDCDESKRRMTLSASGGSLLAAKETFTVDVFAGLQLALQANDDPWTFFSGVSRARVRVHNIVSLFTLGVATGLCPTGVGPWSKTSDKEALPQIQAADMVLSITSAAHYQSVFPNELLGQDPNLYRQCFIFPPLWHREDSPASRATNGLIQYLQKSEADDEAKMALALNLATSADEIVAAAGLCVAVALCDSEPNARLRLLSESFGARVLNFRYTIENARALLGRKNLALQLLKNGDLSEASRLFQIERDLHLIPLLRIDVGEFHDEFIQPLLLFLVHSQVREARAAFDSAAESKPLSSALIIEAAFLDLRIGDLERARQGIASLAGQLSGNLLALAKEIEAVLYLSVGRREEALVFVDEGLAAQSSDEQTVVHLVNLKAEILLALNRPDEALDAFSINPTIFRQSLRALFCRFMAEQRLGDFSKANDTLQELLRYAPADPRVFRTLIKLRQQDAVEGVA